MSEEALLHNIVEEGESLPMRLLVRGRDAADPCCNCRRAIRRRCQGCPEAAARCGEGSGRQDFRTAAFFVGAL